MGNKATTLFPPLEQMLKTFTPTELHALETRFPQQHKSNNGKKGSAAAADDHSFSSNRTKHPPPPPPPYITKDQFLIQLSEGLGPSTRRILLRLFHVLDANASGTLEYEEHVAAAFFLITATQAERARVLFSMYESQSGASSPASSSSSSGTGGGSGSNSKGHLSKSDVASLCAETTLALAELQQQDGCGYDGGGGGGSTSQVTSLAHIDTNSSPFKELMSVMVDVAFARFDADRDGRFNLAEFRNFVTQQYENGVEQLLELIAGLPQVPIMLWGTGVNGGGDGGGGASGNNSNNRKR